jgi:hypothetical protein
VTVEFSLEVNTLDSSNDASSTKEAFATSVTDTVVSFNTLVDKIEAISDADVSTDVSLILDTTFALESSDESAEVVSLREEVNVALADSIDADEVVSLSVLTNSALEDSVAVTEFVSETVSD